MSSLSLKISTIIHKNSGDLAHKKDDEFMPDDNNLYLKRRVNYYLIIMAPLAFMLRNKIS